MYMISAFLVNVVILGRNTSLCVTPSERASPVCDMYVITVLLVRVAI